jgi:signal peptidase I
MTETTGNDASEMPDGRTGPAESPTAARPTTEPTTDLPTDSATDPPTDSARSRARAHQRSSTRNLLEWVAVIVVAVIVALLIKTFAVQAFRIPSESMVPTLEVGDRVLVNKLSYDAHDLHRGDVIVFERPPGLPSGPNDPKDLIKRVIGLPGDTVMTKDGSVYIDGQRLEEPYVPSTSPSYNLDDPVTIPEGQVWVMGDNRTNSEDSRAFGPIDTDTIIGRAFMIMWPPGRVGAL